MSCERWALAYLMETRTVFHIGELAVRSSLRGYAKLEYTRHPFDKIPATHFKSSITHRQR